MPSLANTIKNSTGLAQLTSEELAAQQGRQSAPVTPLETKVTGGNKDQAKMAGTPNQSAGALRSVIQDAGKDLATNERRAQVDRTATTEEAAKVTNAGMAQDRLGKIETQLEDMQQAALKNATAEVQYKPETPADEQALLEIIRTGNQGSPEVLDAISKLNVKKGRTNANLLTGTDLLAEYALDAGAIAEAAGQTFENTLAEGKLDITALGFSSAAEMAGLLGVSEKEMGAMTIPAILDKINSQIQTEYQAVNKQTSAANDPNLPPALRAEARKSLREMGATGVRSAESGMDKLADDLADATSISINGEEMPIEDILKSDSMTGLITGALDSPEKLAELRKTQPALAEYIDKNKAILEAATAQMDESTKAFSQVQSSNAEQSTVKGANGRSIGNVSDEVMSALIPTWGEPTAERYDTTKIPIFQTLNSPRISEAEKLNLKQNLESLNPKYVKDFSNLSMDELKKIGALNPGSPEWEEFQDKLAQDELIQELAASEMFGGDEEVYKDPNLVAEVMGLNNYDEVTKLQKELKQALNFGSITQAEVDKLIPGFQNMSISDLGKHMQKNKTKGIQGALNSKGSFKALQEKLNQAQGKMPDLPANMEAIFTRNKEIDTTLMETISKKANVQNLLDVLGNESLKDKITPGGSLNLRKQLNSKVAAVISGVFSEFKTKVKGNDITSIKQAIADGKLHTKELEQLVSKLDDATLFPYAKTAPVDKTFKDLKEWIAHYNKTKDLPPVSYDPPAVERSEGGKMR